MKRFFSLRRNRAALRGHLRRFGLSRQGVAGIEFAMLLPVMLTMYCGVVEVRQGVMIARKVTALNRALADLTGQTTTIATPDMSNIFDASTSVMLPFTGVTPNMAVTHIVIDDKSVAKVCWAETRNATTPGRNTTVTLPTALLVPNTSLVMAKASHEYKPMIGYVLTGTFSIGGSVTYTRPRLGKAGGTLGIEQIERSGVAMCPPYS